MILIMSHHDIAPDNHARHPNIMRGFVETFDKPVLVYAYVSVDGAELYAPVGRIIAVEQRGPDLYGEMVWDCLDETRHVHMNWWAGMGKVGLSSGFLSLYPHATRWDYLDEEDECYEKDEDFDDARDGDWHTESVDW